MKGIWGSNWFFWKFWLIFRFFSRDFGRLQRSTEGGQPGLHRAQRRRRTRVYIENGETLTLHVRFASRCTMRIMTKMNGWWRGWISIFNDAHVRLGNGLVNVAFWTWALHFMNIKWYNNVFFRFYTPWNIKINYLLKKDTYAKS